MCKRLFGVIMLAVVLAGCGGDEGGVSAEAVHWAERVCQSVGDGAKALAEPPSINPANPANLAQTRDGMVGYLDLLVSALDSVASGITDAGTPPVADGSSAVRAAMATIDETRAAITDAQARLRQAPVTDPVAFQQALRDIGKSMTQLRNVEGPVADLRANPELRAAFSRAASCRSLETPA